jgi:hypothetical protein
MLRILTRLLIAVVLVVPLRAAGPHYSAWSTAQSIGPLVDLANADEGGACFTKDGRTLFFVSNRPGGVGRYDIWVSHWNDATLAWEVPVNLGVNVNSAVGEFTPAISRDEHWLFFASNRPGSMGIRDVYAAYREHTQDDLGWEPAVNLGPVVNSQQDEFGLTYFEGSEGVAPQLYFSSTRGGTFDIYVAEQNLDGTFDPPVLLTELSTAGTELAPAIRHDGLEMLFASNRAGGLGGQDIWATTRESIFDSWSEPVNLGPGVNSPMDELYPALTADNEALLFMRGLVGVSPPLGSLWISIRGNVHP